MEDPEFDKVSKQFKYNTQKLIDLITQQFAPLVDVIDKFLHTIADLSVEYLITGEAREVPESWFFSINVMDAFRDISARIQRSMAKADFAAREKLVNLLIHSVALHQNKAVVKGYIPMTTTDALITSSLSACFYYYCVDF